MSEAPDPRVTPWRPDLAASALRGRLKAHTYADGEARAVQASLAPLRTAPDDRAPLASEALHGEVVTVFEDRDGWAWGQLSCDGYVGYLPSRLLAPVSAPATHRVSRLRTFRYAAPDLKAPVLGWASLNAPLAVASVEGDYARLADGEFVFARHIAPAGERAGDFVAVAEWFAATPYLWGGRTSLGLDCSALVQQSLTAAGIACPRDSDMIEKAVGLPLDRASPQRDLRRGDLLFWRGHCAIMVSGRDLVHANAHHMATVIEPAAEAIGRVAAASGPVTGCRRIADYGLTG